MQIIVHTTTTPVPYENPFMLYKKLSDQGNAISLLMESKSPNQSYERKSMIIPTPALKIKGKNEDFSITALTPTGIKILALLSPTDFSYATQLHQTTTALTGSVPKQENTELSDEARAALPNISFVLKTLLKKFSSNNPYAGLYGVLGYDFARNSFSVPSMLPEISCADFELFIPTEVLVLYDDEKRGERHAFSFNELPFTQEHPVTGYTFTPAHAPTKLDLSNELFCERAAQIIKDIRNGRAMQCVFSQQTTLSLSKHPLRAYEALREQNPSPYSFYYNLGDNEILYGASPEMHIRIDATPAGQVLQIRPVAGTIIRSDNPLEDAEARRNLLNDEKELREHTMLVDLARHELYTVCDTQSVQVTDLFTIENYPNLYHLVSGVRGVLAPTKDAIDALLITLPAGTLSGAPKQEAMKMIESYEGSRRGYYGGASGLIAFNGSCNTGITIRSVHVQGTIATIRAGAGITALSIPQRELAEVQLKLAKVQTTLEEIL